MEKTLNLCIAFTRFAFCLSYIMYCTAWRSWETRLFFPAHFSQKYVQCLRMPATRHSSASSVKEKAYFFLPEALYCFWYVKRNKKKDHSSFRTCISTVLEKLHLLREAQRWSFYHATHADLPPAQEGGISLYLDADGCIHKLTSFPDFMLLLVTIIQEK